MEIIPVQSQSPLPATSAPPRPLAGKIREEGEREVWSDVDKVKIRKDQFFARMLWDLVTEGQSYFTNGEIIKVRSMEQWTELVKMLTNHVDGPVQKGDNNTQINVFKVYHGFDGDRV